MPTSTPATRRSSPSRKRLRGSMSMGETLLVGRQEGMDREERGREGI
jgi:hypothetical protein